MWETTYTWHIFRVIQKMVDVWWGKKRLFEIADRAPGVRILFEKDGRILLSKEFRYDLNAEDFRLPGGKVFDTLSEYVAFLDSRKDIGWVVIQAATREALEEVGIKINACEIRHIDLVGTTVRRDLYYVKAIEFEEMGEQDLGEGEYITADRYSYDQVIELMKTGKVSESRTKAFLYDYILGNDLQNK